MYLFKDSSTLKCFKILNFINAEKLDDNMFLMNLNMFSVVVR